MNIKSDFETFEEALASESRFHMKYHDDDVTTYAIGVEID